MDDGAAPEQSAQAEPQQPAFVPAQFSESAYFDTVLTGAGISHGPPANLPLGQQLSVLLWRLVAHGHHFEPLSEAIDKAAALILRGEGPGVMLETLAEGLRHEIGDLVVRVYDAVAVRQPTFAHQALATLGAQQLLTVNMDVLHEAAQQPALHLHGDINHPASIKTTIGDYLKGLPSDLNEALREAVEGHDVVTLGYSGRDYDILPVIARSHPRSMLFSLRDGEDLDPVVAEFLLDTNVRVWHGDLDAKLASCLDAGSVPHPTPIPASEGPDFPTVDLAAIYGVPVLAEFAALDPKARGFAMGTVFFRLQMFDEALATYRLLRERGMDSPAVRKHESRVWHAISGSANDRKGLHAILTAPVRSLRDAVEFAGCVNEGIARARTLGHISATAAISVAQRTMATAAGALLVVSHTRAAVEQRKANLTFAMELNIMGHAHRAIAIFEQLRRDAKADGDASTYVSACLWEADAERSLGHPRTASKLIDMAASFSPHETGQNRHWIAWKRAEVELSAGPSPAAEQMLTDLAAESDHDQQAWLFQTLSDAVRDRDLSLSRDYLDESARHMLRHTDGDRRAHHRLIDARVTWHLHRAEIARLEADAVACLHNLDAARRLGSIRRVAPFGRPIAHVWSTVIAAELALATKLDEGWQLLTRALHLAQQHGVDSATLRCRVTAMEVVGRTDDRLAWVARQLGNRWEAKRIEGEQPGLEGADHLTA